MSAERESDEHDEDLRGGGKLAPTPSRCLLARGYDVRHYQIKERETMGNLIISRHRVRKPEYRGPAAVMGPLYLCRHDNKPTLPVYIPGDSAENQSAAVRNRVARKVPGIPPSRSADFLSYVRQLVVLMYPNPPRDYTTFDDFISRSNYSGARKKHLTLLRDGLTQLEEWMFNIKSFIKWEIYDEVKQPRAINAPTEETVVIAGPLMHTLDKYMFHGMEGRSRFVKGTNPRDWPKLLDELFGNQAVRGTDFSAFESHHFGALGEVYRIFFAHATKNMNLPLEVSYVVGRLLRQRNKLKFKHIKAEVDEKLMSGTLWTSSANGLLNFMVSSYLAACHVRRGQTVEDRVSWTFNNFVGVFEGDDGLTVDYGVTQEECDEFGVILTPDPRPNAMLAGFCSIYCDIERDVVFKDPISFLRKFFWMPPKYESMSDNKKRAYMKAKSLSILNIMPSAPIISQVAWHVLQRTKWTDERTAQYETYHDYGMARVQDVLRAPKIDPGTRELVSQIFGVTPEEQEFIESHFTGESDTVRLELDQFVYPDPNGQYHLDNFYRMSIEEDIEPKYVREVEVEWEDESLRDKKAPKPIRNVFRQLTVQDRLILDNG